MRYATIFILMLCALSAHAQKLLFHKKSYREVFYKTGEPLTFRSIYKKGKIKEVILGFEGDSLILFEGFKIAPQSITHLYVDEKTKGWYILRYKYDKLLLVGGIGYLLFDILNRQSVYPNTLKYCSISIGAGLLAKILISKKMKIKGQRKLLIVY